MAQMTTEQVFAPWLSGKYDARSAPRSLWGSIDAHTLQADAFLDAFDAAEVLDEMCDGMRAAIDARDVRAFRALLTRAQEIGAPADVCEVVRRTLDAVYS